MSPRRRTPARCTSWSAPERAALPAPLARSPCAPTLASLGRCAAGAHPQIRFFAGAVCPCPGQPRPSPRARPVCFCQRGSPDSLPFPGVCGAGAPGGGGCGSAAGLHPGPQRRPPHKFLLGSETPGPAGSGAGGGSSGRREGPGQRRRGRARARAGGVRARRGGTALNALDSPAPAPAPPSSADSWGLCFLHPPAGRAPPPPPHVTRRLPPRGSASPPPGPARATAPFRGCGVETPAGERPSRSEVTRRRASWKVARWLEP